MSAPGSQGSELSSPSASSPRMSSVVGLACGSLWRQPRMRSSRPAVTPVRSGSSCAMRNSRACISLAAAPKGSRPVRAYVSTDPRQKTSLAALTRSPRTCSGDMKPGEPTSAPVRVRPPSVTVSRALAIPKSMTRGPSIVSRMLEGFRSRWMRPAVWMAFRARARPAPRMRTDRSGRGPNVPGAGPDPVPGPPETVVWRDGPATYPVATHGTSASVSASSTGAVQVEPTVRAARTSCRNRSRNTCWAASSSRTSLSATVRPRSERAR